MSMQNLPPELAEQMHNTMRVTGQTEEAYLAEAIRLYEWAAEQARYGHSIASVDRYDGSTTKREISSFGPLVEIAEYFESQMMSEEEHLRQLQLPGYPAEEVLAEMRKLLEQHDANAAIRPVFSVGSRSIGEPV